MKRINKIIVSDKRNKCIYTIEIVRSRFLLNDEFINYFMDRQNFSLSGALRGSKSYIYNFDLKPSSNHSQKVLDYYDEKIENTNNNHNSFKHSKLKNHKSYSYLKGTDIFTSGFLRKLNSISYFEVSLR